MAMLFALILRGISFEFPVPSHALPAGLGLRLRGRLPRSRHLSGPDPGGFIQGVAVENDHFAGGPFSFITFLGLLCAPASSAATRCSGWLADLAHRRRPSSLAREVAHAAPDPRDGDDGGGQRLDGLDRAAGGGALVRMAGQPVLDLFPLAAVGVAVLIWRSL